MRAGTTLVIAILLLAIMGATVLQLVILAD